MADRDGGDEAAHADFRVVTERERRVRRCAVDYDPDDGNAFTDDGG
jgi:hypothetical protein